MKNILIIFLLLWPGSALAGDVAGCISLGVKGKSQTLTNNCRGTKVHVIWCHGPSDKDRSTECGHNGKYFQQNSVLEHGESAGNMFSMPLGATINYGVCEGSYGTATPVGKNTENEYYCKAQKNALGETTPFTVTTSGQSKDEVCMRAQTLASESGQVPGECACELRGSLYVCRVQSIGPKPKELLTDSLINKSRAKIREETKCKPGDNDCTKRVMSNPGGIRN
jgi:hypothetical protein